MIINNNIITRIECQTQNRNKLIVAKLISSASINMYFVFNVMKSAEIFNERKRTFFFSSLTPNSMGWLYFTFECQTRD